MTTYICQFTDQLSDYVHAYIVFLLLAYSPVGHNDFSGARPKPGGGDSTRVSHTVQRLKDLGQPPLLSQVPSRELGWN